MVHTVINMAILTCISCQDLCERSCASTGTFHERDMDIWLLLWPRQSKQTPPKTRLFVSRSSHHGAASSGDICFFLGDLISVFQDAGVWYIFSSILGAFQSYIPACVALVPRWINVISRQTVHAKPPTTSSKMIQGSDIFSTRLLERCRRGRRSHAGDES